MRKRTLKATLAAILAVILLAFSFIGCTPQTKVLCDTDTLRIERTGTVTTIYDLVGDELTACKLLGERMTESEVNASDD